MVGESPNQLTPLVLKSEAMARQPYRVATVDGYPTSRSSHRVDTGMANGYRGWRGIAAGSPHFWELIVS